MSGYLGNLSAEQELALQEMRCRIQEIENGELRTYALKVTDDPILLRFLRARRFNVDASFTMLENTLKFRKSFQGIGVDAITCNMILNELRPGKSFFHNYDKEGRPVCVIRARYHEPAKVDPLEAQRFCVFQMEYARKCLLKPPVETVTIIFDMTDFSMKNNDFRSLKFMIQMLQNYYPESLGRVLVYNSTWLFWTIWKLVSPLLDPVTAAKVCFANKDTITNYIHEDNLLMEFGGKDPYNYDFEAAVAQMTQEVLNAEQ
jgi:hypothetical protein